MNTLILFCLLLLVLLFSYRKFNISNRIILIIIITLILLYLCYYFYTKSDEGLSTFDEEESRLHNCFGNPMLDDRIDENKQKIIDNFQNSN